MNQVLKNIILAPMAILKAASVFMEKSQGLVMAEQVLLAL